MRQILRFVLPTLAIWLITQSLAFGVLLAWDPTIDFDTENNPQLSGFWSYGWVSKEDFNAGGYGLTLFDTVRTWNSLIHWGIPSSTEPAVLYNPDPANYHPFGNNVAPLTVALHPGASDEKATVEWTAPEAGIVSIVGAFFACQWGYPTVDTHVMHNGISIFDSTLWGGTSELTEDPFSLLLTVAEGDKIDFAVGHGGNGYNWDATNFRVQIIKVSEPGSLLIIGNGLLAFMVAVVRRRR